MSSPLRGRFLTTGPPGKSWKALLMNIYRAGIFYIILYKRRGDWMVANESLLVRHIWLKQKTA